MDGSDQGAAAAAHDAGAERPIQSVFFSHDR